MGQIAATAIVPARFTHYPSFMIKPLWRTASNAARAAVLVAVAKASHDATVRVLDWLKIRPPR